MRARRPNVPLRGSRPTQVETHDGSLEQRKKGGETGRTAKERMTADNLRPGSLPCGASNITGLAATCQAFCGLIGQARGLLRLTIAAGLWYIHSGN